MTEPFTHAIRRLVRSSRSAAERYSWRRHYAPTLLEGDRAAHLREAVAWLCRAQDAGDDRGISYGVPFGGTFAPSYPETTGYIIPTFLALEQAWNDPAYRQRAWDAAQWEVDVQMSTGAVMAGKLNAAPRPAIFNTGQVLIGWASIARVVDDARIEHAARAACQWMLAMQEADGRWVRGNSPFANADTTTYNVKAAWGLCEAGVQWEWPDAVAGATRNAEACLRSQRANGWFEHCCLDAHEQPLLHTLAYTVQGLLCVGLLTGREDFVAGARKAADALLRRMSPDGYLPGRFADDWSGRVTWCCLTGSAQMSNVWSDLYQLTGELAYRQGREIVNGYLVARHDITHADPAIRGGVPGSWPTSGGYGRHKILNWATKFFVDALLAEQGVQRPHLYARALSRPGELA